MSVKLAALLKGALVSAILFLGLLWIDTVLSRQADMVAQEMFEANADRAAVIISERTNQVAQRLQDIGSVIAYATQQEGSVTQSFHSFASASDVLAEHPEMVAIGHFDYATAQDLDSVIARTNADPWRDTIGLPPTELRPAGIRDQYVIISSIFPADEVPDGAGLDMLETPRRDTILQAMDLRQPQITPRMDLLTGAPGVVLFVPVYLDPDDPNPAAFVSTAFATDIFLQQLSGLLAPLELELEIHDMGQAAIPGGALGLETLLTSTAPVSLPEDGEDISLLSFDPDAQARDINVGGRVWRIMSRPAAGYRAAPNSETTFATTIGILASVLVGVMVYRRSLLTYNLEREVARKTKDLTKAANILEEERAAAVSLAQRDELTGLLNRRGFEDAAKELASQCQSHNCSMALVAIDLDGFKGVNDTLGHQGGDELLKRVADHLRDVVPPKSAIGRMGGDEFLVCTIETAEAKATELAEAVIEWAKKPQMINGNQIRFGASAGLARAPWLSAKPDGLLVDADLALYNAKGTGKGKVCDFDHALRVQTETRRAIAEDLQTAFEQDEFVPYFQTQHDGETLEVIGIEALVRWIKQDGTIVPPGDFLPAVENIGRLQDLDLLVMQKAVDAVRRLEAKGLNVHKLGINVSLPRLRAAGFIESIQALPDMNARLHLEILETVFVDDGSAVRDWALDLLRESGIGIEVDDFGSGHASVIGLTRLAPDILKIDRSLIFPLVESREQQIVIKSIAEIGAALGIRVTAEGVESMEHANMLRDIGVDILQGFAFSRPMPEQELERLLLRKAA